MCLPRTLIPSLAFEFLFQLRSAQRLLLSPFRNEFLELFAAA
jgi:hypothetical protein